MWTLAFLACGAWGAAPADNTLIYGTNVWQGATSGGDWSDATNWRAVNAGTYTAAQLLGTNCVYDISTLENGAVLTNNTADLKISGIVTRSGSSQGTVTLTGKSALLMGQTQIFINHPDTVLVWEMDHVNNWWNKDGNELLLVLGTGTLRVTPANQWSFYLREIQPCHSTTLELSSKCYFSLAYIHMWNNATLRLLGNVTLAHLMCTSSPQCKVDLNGYTLSIAGGEKAWNLSQIGNGFTGRGNLNVAGGNDVQFDAAPAYTGNLALYTGRLVFPFGVTLPTTVFPVVNGPNRMIFNTKQTLARISGDGVAGGIQMPDTVDSTLTLTGTGGVNEATVYNARLYGKDVVKTGANYTLTLTGDNCYSGTTAVAAGTLCLRRPPARHGLVSHWSFNDPANLGRDDGPAESILSFAKFGTGVTTQRFDGVDHSYALGLDTTGEAKTGCGYAATAAMTRANGYPLGNDPLSVMLWYKPKAGNSTGPGYVFRLGNWGANGGQFVLWQRGDAKMSWHIDNWVTSDTADSPQFDCPGLCDGNWHLLAATYENQTLKVYYDGQLVRTTTTTHALNMASYRVILGNNDAAPNSTGSNHYVHGGFDEVSVWSRVLADEEIAEEYARTCPDAVDPAAALPAPICHWAFDDAADVGKDSMGGSSLVANPHVVYTPSTEQFTGAFGRNLTTGSSLVLPVASQPANFPTGQAPFTISFRCLPSAAGENVDILRLGGTGTVSTNSADYFRLWQTSCPRRLCVTCGNVGGVSNQAFNWSNNYSTRPGTWTHIVVTVDPVRGVLKAYRDGHLEFTKTGFSANLAAGSLILNATSPSSSVSTSFRVDDLQIFDTVLDPHEVMTLVRSLEKGAVGPVLPATSPVTVASGARLCAQGERHDVMSIAGAGEVNVQGRISAADWSGFTGTLTGPGCLVLSTKGEVVPLAAASVTANVAFESNVVALAAGQTQTPRVRTQGHVFLPTNGVLRLTGEHVTAGQWPGKRFKIAECASFSGATNTVGWTFEPAASGLKLEGTFTMQAGTLVLSMKGGGSVVILR